MKIKSFQQQLNESSYSDFLMHYDEEIENVINLLTKLKNIEIDEEKYDKISEILKKYDTNVQSKIDEWIYDTPTPNEITEFAIKNQDRWGTEPQMVLFAIEEYADALGIYNYEGLEENTNIELFEVYKDKVTFEMSGSPKPFWVTKAEFVADMQDWGYTHTTLNKNTDMLIVASEDLGTLKCQKAEKYGIPIYTYSEAFKKREKLYKKLIRGKKIENIEKNRED